jgi:tripartite-type tricarboxylate transporter receptor subunit TctC
MSRPIVFARRNVLLSAAALLAAPAFAEGSFPQRPVSIVVPTTAGGTADILARLIGSKLSQTWGQPVVIENKPGAGGLIGAEYTKRAAPDGHTLMLTFNELASLPAINKNVRLDVVRDFTRIGRIGSLGVLVLAHPSMNASTLAELIATLRNNPGKYTYASNGAGSVLQLFTEMFKKEAKVDILHIPYRGALEASTALIAGEVDVLIQFASGNVQSYVKSGRVKAYAVASAARLPGLPEVPTSTEAGLPGFRLEAWYGLFGPAGIKPAIAEQINRDLTESMKHPDVAQRLAAVNLQAQPGSVAGFDAFFRVETKRWGELIASSGIKSNE